MHSIYIAYYDSTIPMVNGHEFVFEGDDILDMVLASENVVRVIRVDSFTELKSSPKPEVRV